MALATFVVGLLATGAYVAVSQSTQRDRKYRSEVQVLIPAIDEEEGIRPRGVPGGLLQAQETLANSPETQRRAFELAALAEPDQRTVELDARQSSAGDIVSMRATAPDREIAERTAVAYASAYRGARATAVGNGAQSGQRSSRLAVESLTRRLRVVERELRQSGVRLPDVIRVRGSAGQETPLGVATEEGDEEGEGGTPILNVPQGLPIDQVLLLYERNTLVNRINDAQFRYAELATSKLTPSSFSEIVERRQAVAVGDAAPSVAIPLGAGLAASLVLAVGIPVLVDRVDRSVRTPREAAAALDAPVLSQIPAPPEGEWAIAAPGSPQDAAFRSLAATSVATGRLPRAILVTSPVGSVQDGVAANFAAALATLGMRVALVATTPRQDWFVTDWDGATPLPQLLEQAHTGRLDGQLRQHLGRTHLENLVVVPPGVAETLELSLDGLPPLLEVLERADIDVTVIAGPPLLDDANATIIAWATRSVLWAVRSGEVTEAEARDAAARLELAGVHPFGVAIVGQGR